MNQIIKQKVQNNAEEAKPEVKLKIDDINFIQNTLNREYRTMSCIIKLNRTD